MASLEMPPILSAPGLFANDTVCYSRTMVTTNGMFLNEDPMTYSLPVFLFQILVIVLTCRLFTILLKPLNQSRVFAEFMAGIFLGPSAMGRWFPWMGAYIFARNTLVLLETIANLGVLYFAFIIGLQMDLLFIRKNWNRGLLFAISGIFLPILIGVAFSFYLHDKTTMRKDTFLIFFSVSLSITALPILSRILEDIRFLHTEIGKMAKLVALINEILGVALLEFAISLAETQTAYKTTLWVIVSSMFLVVFSIFVVRPGITWLASKSTPEDESFSTFTISTILAGVMIFGFVTDCIGVHPVFGAFVFGLIFPNGPLAISLMERLEDYITGFLLPLFFVISGFKTNVAKIQGASTWFTIISASILSSIGKVVGTVLVALFLNMPFREGVALGLLTNSKGLIEYIGLSHGRDQKAIDDTGYAIMVVMTVLMNAFIMPIVVKVYKQARKFMPYKRRTIQQTQANADLRILACIHIPRNVPTIISLLEDSYAIRRSPISVFSLHLVELTGHASATLIVHDNSQNSDTLAINKMQAQSDNIINAFKTFERKTSYVSVQSLTSISSYSTMHQEICNLAEDRRVAFIIIPFHKQPSVDGGMESANPKLRALNQNVLANAPCSVGILVDRGLSGSKSLASGHVSHSIAMLFFGGPDDREALSYAMRMSENPKNALNVIRFLPGPEAVNDPNQDPDHEREKQLDDDCIKELRMMKANDESFTYFEKVVNNAEQTVATIRAVNNIHDLFVVGRGEGVVSPLTTGLSEWSESPEIGVIGDLLASSDFSAAASVLVVQQYMRLALHNEQFKTRDSGVSKKSCML